ncbi:MAG: cold shock domain-containing protein [Alphaproteobacteria bacterium]
MTHDQFHDQQEITHHEITAVVKWFNPTKGFGFVQPTDGSPDAFMHVSVVERSGLNSLPQGATIICDLCTGQKGPQVAAVHRVESMPEAPPPHDEGGEASEVDGTVKFYNGEKGFGFVVPDGGGKDVFVSARVLERAGIRDLEPDQRLRMMTRMGQKGPMADSVALI